MSLVANFTKFLIQITSLRYCMLKHQMVFVYHVLHSNIDKNLVQCSDQNPITNVPEVLNLHMNEIYKKLTTIKENKLKFKKVLKKITFSFSKVNFSLLEKNPSKKVDFFIIFVHMKVQNSRSCGRNL